MSRKESESSGHRGEKVREESKCRRVGQKWHSHLRSCPGPEVSDVEQKKNNSKWEEPGMSKQKLEYDLENCILQTFQYLGMTAGQQLPLKSSCFVVVVLLLSV